MAIDMRLVGSRSEWLVFVRNASPAQMDAMLEVIQHDQQLPQWAEILEEARKRLHVASVEGTLKVRSVTGTDKHERL